MPTVPRTTGPSVALQGGPNVRLTTQFQDSGSRRLTQAIGETAQVVDEWRAREQEKADEAALFGARTQLAEWEKGWFDPSNEQGVHSARGQRALELPDRIMPDYQRRLGEIQETLQPRQRDAFQRVAFQFQEQLDSRVTRHVLGEQERYLETVEKASLATISERASVAAREGRGSDMQSEIALGHAQLDIQAQRQGMPSEAAEMLRKEFTSQTYVSAVDGMLEQGDYAGAVAFYRENADSLVENDRRRMDNTVRNAELLVEQRTRANEIIGQYGSGSRAVREAEKITDPMLRDRVINAIDQEDRRRERAEAQYERALKEQAYSALFSADPSTPIDQAVPPATLARMDPQTLMAFQSFQERRLAGTASRTDPRVYERLATLPPEELLEEDIDAHYVGGSLSLADANRLKAGQEEIRNPKPESEHLSQTESQMFTEMFTLMGVPPTGGTAREREARGDFRLRYEEAKRDRERDMDRKMTGEERLDLMNRLSIQVARERPRSWFPGMTTDRARAFELEPEELREYTVPRTAREMIQEEANAAGVNLSEEDIRAIYVENAERFNRMGQLR